MLVLRMNECRPRYHRPTDYCVTVAINPASLAVIATYLPTYYMPCRSSIPAVGPLFYSLLLPVLPMVSEIRMTRPTPDLTSKLQKPRHDIKRNTQLL